MRHRVLYCRPMPARKIALRLLLGMLFVGVVAAIVYGFCQLIVTRPGIGSIDLKSGRSEPYQVTHRRGPPTTVYVSPAYIVTVRVSGWIAGLCLAPLAILGLALLYGNALRLVIPARYEWANRELARYRASAGAGGVTEEGLRYVDAWRNLHRRTSLLVCVFALIGILAVVRPPGAWALVAGFGWAVALVLVGLWQGAFPCPRCGKRFHGKRRTSAAPMFCTNCGLPQEATATTAVAPDFAKWKSWN